MNAKYQWLASRCAVRAKLAPDSIPSQANAWFESMTPLTARKTAQRRIPQFATACRTRNAFQRPLNSDGKKRRFSATCAAHRASRTAPRISWTAVDSKKRFPPISASVATVIAASRTMRNFAPAGIFAYFRMNFSSDAGGGPAGA